MSMSSAFAGSFVSVIMSAASSALEKLLGAFTARLIQMLGDINYNKWSAYLETHEFPGENDEEEEAPGSDEEVAEEELEDGEIDEDEN